MDEPDATIAADCRPFERRWRNYCVDRNLKDDWLERLNELVAFDLISICEGHGSEAETEHYRLPHFNLRLKEELVALLGRRWGRVRDGIAAALDAAFRSDIVSAHFEQRSGFVKEEGLTPQDIALLKITARVRILEFDASYYGDPWFEENIAAAEEFDRAMATLLLRAD